MPQSHDKFTLRIAVIKPGDRGHATNKTVEWENLRKRLSLPKIDHDTTSEAYARMNADQRNKLKDVGAFVGGHFKDGKRKRDNIEERSIVTLDIDAATPAQIEILNDGLSALSSYEFFGSTTRSHTATTPKWRLVFPTTRTVTAEEYAPLSRILASKLFNSVSESMDATDDVSYRVAQIMYWPSRNADGKFETIYNQGGIVDPDEVFDAFGAGWKDWTQLPYSEKRGQKRPTGAKKAENPTEKRGIVGAFCRAYDVPTAIAKFISDVYTIGEKEGKKQRYTYAKGSGANGAIVEDGGLFLYSHHGTDPCGERLVNAFDLVRIHLFGHEDAGTAEDVGPTGFPSYKAFQDFLGDDEPTVTEMRKDQYDLEAIFDDVEDGDDTAETDSGDEFADLLGEATKPAKNADWMNGLETDTAGLIKPTLTNLAIICQNDPRIKGVVELNEFIQEPVTRKPIAAKMQIIPKVPIADGINGDLWTDRHDNCIRALIEAPHGKGKPGYGMKVTDRDLKSAIDLSAAKLAFHPVRDYLQKLVWDGKPRIDRLFVDYLGAKNTPYTRGIARLMFLGAVTRVFEPGHKFDYVVILEGIQGRGKSTFIATLAKSWFVEMEGELDDRKQLVEKMQGAWILEIPELSGFGKAEIQKIKAVFSASHDKIRMSYDKRAKKFFRQCIFVGSTNDGEYLRDPTGGRRFWPVPCEDKQIDIARLEGEIDQMWAEGFAAYSEMRKAQPKGRLPLFLSDVQAAAEALEMQESRRIESVEDSYAGIIEDWLDQPVTDNEFEDVDDMTDSTVRRWRRNEICMIQVWVECFGRPQDQYTEGMARSLGRAMKLVKGWDAIGTRTTSYGKQRSYRRTGTVGAALELIKPDDDLGI